MMRTHRNVLPCLVALASLVVYACDDAPEAPPPVNENATTETPGPDTTLTEDERGSVGPASPAAEYCQKLGFKAESPSRCVFPDWTSCEQWSFYRGTCGQERSYCNQHGGTISSRDVDMGGWTAAEGICTLAGKSCKEDTFFRTGKCE